MLSVVSCVYTQASDCMRGASIVNLLGSYPSFRSYCKGHQEQCSLSPSADILHESCMGDASIILPERHHPERAAPHVTRLTYVIFAMSRHSIFDATPRSHERNRLITLLEQRHPEVAMVMRSLSRCSSPCYIAI